MVPPGTRSWWRPLLEDGSRGFVVIAADGDVETEQRAPGTSDWQEVTPVAFYRELLAVESARPDADEAEVEALEETLDLWEREEATSG